jgi:enediyne polyketide synthase
LRILDTWLATDVDAEVDATRGIALGWAERSARRVGFLFPGQGSPSNVSGGIWRRRFEHLGSVYESLGAIAHTDFVATQVAQPAIVTNSIAALRVLAELGIRGAVSVGHSLGELTALHWAGAFDEAALVRIATARGRAMADLGASN